MDRKLNYRALGYGSLIALTLVAGRALLPLNSSHAQTPTEAYPLFGIVRDFRPGHADVNATAGNGLAMSAGNVAGNIGPNGTPMYSGIGRTVLAQARDSKGRAIAASSASPGAVTDFEINGANVTSSKPMAAKITVIGAALEAGNTVYPVTMQVRVGTKAYEFFGDYGSVAGDVNDGKNPRHAIVPDLIMPGTALTVDGRSWVERNGTHSMHMTADSTSGQVLALRNGDTPPNVAGYGTQISAKEMLAPYLSNGKVTLKSNQVIYLFEIWTTDRSSSAYDMQDLVVLVDLANDPSYFNEDPKNPPCVQIADTAAQFGTANGGGVSSGTTFSQWFTDAIGENASRRQKIEMARGADGTYSYYTEDFTPIDGALYGNQGLEHNRGFTYTIDAGATYSKCGGQFLEYTGTGDAWVYVNGKLVLDLGGTHANASQYVDFDRLGLADNSPMRIQIFYAQRTSSDAAFGLRTNIVLNSTTAVNVPTVSGLHD